MDALERWQGPPTPNRALPWNSLRLRRTRRCGWCRRAATRLLKGRRTGFVIGYEQWWWHPACDACWQRERRYRLPRTVLTRQSRRLRWVLRCGCGRPVRYVAVTERDHRGLHGQCRECWLNQRVFSTWFNVACRREALVRRNVAYGQLRAQLLRWTKDRELERAARTWRRLPQPPFDGGGGGTPLCLPRRACPDVDVA